MSSRNNFYSFTDEPNKDSQKKMWKRINKEIKKGSRIRFENFDVRSFSFGFAAAVLAFFAVVGFYSTISKLSYENLPDHVRVNKAYYKAIADVEQALPLISEVNERPIYVDDRIISQREELENINKEIYSLSGAGSKYDYSKIKQLRLREFYRLKLKIIDDIIALEETDDK